MQDRHNQDRHKSFIEDSVKTTNKIMQTFTKQQVFKIKMLCNVTETNQLKFGFNKFYTKLNL